MNISRKFYGKMQSIFPEMLGICRACDGKCQRHFPSILGKTFGFSVRNSVRCYGKTGSVFPNILGKIFDFSVEGKVILSLQSKSNIDRERDNVV